MLARVFRLATTALRVDIDRVPPVEGLVQWSLIHEETGVAVDLPLGLPMVVGRAPDAPIRLPLTDNLGSRYHATLQASMSGVELSDLSSTNGVWVNGGRVHQTRLSQGATIQIGAQRFRVLAVVPALQELGPEPTFDLRTPALAPAFGLSTQKATPYRCEICGLVGPVPAIDHEPYWIDLEWICPGCANHRRSDPAYWPTDVPPRIGDYEILSPLGEGGMAHVFEARHQRAGIRAAVKVMRSEHAIEEAGRRRFVREQRILASLVHPHVVRRLDVGELHGGLLYVVTEFMSRGDAEGFAHRRASIGAVVTLSADMYEGLAYAHAQGYVHRDVKPGNLLLCKPDELRRPRGKLADFGLAKNFRDAGGTVVTSDSEVGGSACFVAPEQLLGFRDVGPTADIYSAAASMYYLFTQELPVQITCAPPDATDAQLCLAALADERVPLRKRRPDIHADLAAWIDLLVSRDPQRRAHLKAAQIAEMLRAFPGA